MINIDQILKTIEVTEHSALFYTPPYYPGAKSYFFNSPFRILQAKNIDEFEYCCLELAKLTKQGAMAYAVINYECGFLFEKKLHPLLNKGAEILLSIFVFNENNYDVLDSRKIKIDEWNNESFLIDNFALNTSSEKYIRDIDKIKEFISTGDTYQVNYTVKGKFDFDGSAAGLFRSLIFNQSAQYSAFINAGKKMVLSISPELFFEIDGCEIKTRPMKGTINRAYNHTKDEEVLNSLINSDKNRAENVMIVDLLRNDLGRISEFGTVNVEDLFSIEKYETLFQMISTISSHLREDVHLSEIIKNIFPCGSITGAPKIRTMEIINEIETEQRGLYTGALGIISDQKSVFSVAIRTVEIMKSENKGEIGLGSGIVWDSEPEKEYEETLLKSKFLTRPEKYFEVFETMLIKKGKIYFLKEHLERLKKTCEFFLFLFEEPKVVSACSDLMLNVDQEKSYKLKLKLTKWGEIKSQIYHYHPFHGEVKIILSVFQTVSKDPYVHFKTTNRNLYDDEYNRYSQKGYFDVIFTNEKENITEGAISNIFVVKNDNWYTPLLSDGILDGIYRNHIIQKKGIVKEKSLETGDLLTADNLYLTNSVRGLVKVNKLFIGNKEARVYS